MLRWLTTNLRTFLLAFILALAVWVTAITASNPDQTNTDGDALIAAMKGMKWESPRGPMSIDPETRDIVQNIYIRKVERKNGELFNVALRRHLVAELAQRGIRSVAPLLSPAWHRSDEGPYAPCSNWSERHAAHHHDHRRNEQHRRFAAPRAERPVGSRGDKQGKDGEHRPLQRDHHKIIDPPESRHGAVDSLLAVRPEA